MAANTTDLLQLMQKHLLYADAWNLEGCEGIGHLPGCAEGLFYAQDRGALFIGPGVKVYEGMVVGVSPKQEDITVNVCKKKQMTNMRAAGSDDALRLVPPRRLSLEQCLAFLANDALLEVTPEHLRIRKTILNHEKRMKATHGGKKN